MLNQMPEYPVQLNGPFPNSWGLKVLSANLAIVFFTGLGFLLIVLRTTQITDLFLSPLASPSNLRHQYPAGLSKNVSGIVPSQSSQALSKACRRTMKYLMHDKNGFFSELHLVIRIIVIGRSHDYEVLIDDSSWNYGHLSDYFDLDPSSCKLPDDWKDMPRTEFCEKNGHLADHVRLNRSCTEHLDRIIGEQIPYKVKEVQSVWNFLNARDDLTVMPAGQNLHSLLKPLFDAQSTELHRVWKLNNKVKSMADQLSRNMTAKISASAQRTWPTPRLTNPKVIVCHYRLGDKEQEHSDHWMGSHLVGLPSTFDRPTRYVRVAQQMIRDFGWGSGHQKPLLIVMSDNMNHAFARLDTQSKSFDPAPLKVMSLSTLDGGELQAGHIQYSFNEKPSSARIESARWLLSEVEWVRRHADGVVCTVISNVCVALMLLGGAGMVLGSEPKIRSIDQRWMPTPHLRQLDAPQLSISQLLARAETLAREKENQIHL